MARPSIVERGGFYSHVHLAVTTFTFTKISKTSLCISGWIARKDPTMNITVASTLFIRREMSPTGSLRVIKQIRSTQLRGKAIELRLELGEITNSTYNDSSSLTKPKTSHVVALTSILHMKHKIRANPLNRVAIRAHPCRSHEGECGVSDVSYTVLL